MKKVAQLVHEQELSVEERNLLSVSTISSFAVLICIDQTPQVQV